MGLMYPKYSSLLKNQYIPWIFTSGKGKWEVPLRFPLAYLSDCEPTNGFFLPEAPGPVLFTNRPFPPILSSVRSRIILSPGGLHGKNFHFCFRVLSYNIVPDHLALQYGKLAFPASDHDFFS